MATDELGHKILGRVGRVYVVLSYLSYVAWTKQSSRFNTVRCRLKYYV